MVPSVYLRRCWTDQRLGCLLRSSFVTIKDRKAVLVGTKEGKLYALDRALGTLIWQTVLTSPNPTESIFGGLQGFACTDGETIYCSAIYSQTGFPLTGSVSVPATAVIAIRVCDGAILWRRDINGGTFNALTLANGVLYQNTAGERNPPGTGALVGAKSRAFDAKTGKILFEYDNAISTLPSGNETAGGTTTYKDTIYWSLGGNLNNVTPSVVGSSGVAAFRIMK